MGDIKVAPGALRAFADDCTATATAMNSIDAGSVAAAVPAGLPGTARPPPPPRRG